MPKRIHSSLNSAVKCNQLIFVVYSSFLARGGHSLVRPMRVCAAEQGMVFKPGGHSLIWPMRACAAEQAMVFKVLVLNRVYNFTIKCLEQGVFLGKPFKECEHLR